MERPITGCSVILYQCGKILLVKRSKPPFESHWSLPGGSQNFGETLEACARRELAEETGLEVDALMHLATRDYISDDDQGPRHHFVLTTYCGNGYEGQLKAGDDASDCAWFGLDEIAVMDTTPGLHEFLTTQTGAFAHKTDKLNNET